MKKFRAVVPDFGSKAIAPLRVGSGAQKKLDPQKTLDELKVLRPPFDEEMQAELIALSFVHTNAKVRKKAMSVAKQHIPDVADFKAAYKSLANVGGYIVDERVRAFEHPLQVAVAMAMAFYRQFALSVPFEKDKRFRAAILDIALQRAKRDGERSIKLGEIYWYWTGSQGSATGLDLHQLPPGLFAELGRLRKRYAFAGLSIHGNSLTALPDEIKKAKSWLKHLELNYAKFKVFPEVIFQLTNLESLEIVGTSLDDIPDGITALKKLRFLDIGNQRKMKEIPASVCRLDRLESLRIGNGSIRRIPEDIGQMKSLRTLEMQSTQITKLPKSMADMPNLKTVKMRFCGRLTKAKARESLGSGVRVDA